jgi:hypothetical protein
VGGVARLLIICGLVSVAVGVILLVAGRVPLLGRMPGDITIRRDGLTVYLPLGTGLALSVVLSLLLFLWRR